MNDAPALAEAILKLCANPQLARKMGLAGKKRALKRFDISATVASVQDVYETLLARKCQP